MSAWPTRSTSLDVSRNPSVFAYIYASWAPVSRKLDLSIKRFIKNLIWMLRLKLSTCRLDHLKFALEMTVLGVEHLIGAHRRVELAKYTTNFLVCTARHIAALQVCMLLED